MTVKYVLRDLPGLAELEAKLARIEAHPNPDWAPDNDDLDEVIEAFTMRNFGMTVDGIEGPDGSGMRAMEVMKQSWEELGWDVTNGAGEDLRAVEWVGLAIACVIAGLGGYLPDQASSRDLGAAEVDSIERSLAAEAAKFRRGK